MRRAKSTLSFYILFISVLFISGLMISVSFVAGSCEWIQLKADGEEKTALTVSVSKDSFTVDKNPALSVKDAEALKTITLSSIPVTVYRLIKDKPVEKNCKTYLADTDNPDSWQTDCEEYVNTHWEEVKEYAKTLDTTSFRTSDKSFSVKCEPGIKVKIGQNSYEFGAGDITYNNLFPFDGSTYMTIWYYDNTTDTFSSIPSGSTTFDYFPDNPTNDSAIIFGIEGLNRPTHFKGIQLNIGTPMSSTTHNITWEYWDGGDYVTRFGIPPGKWVPLPGVIDDCVNLTVAGLCNVSWQPPDDWGVIFKLNSASRYYIFPVRARISNAVDVTEGGKQTTDVVKVHDNAISFSGFPAGTPATLRDMAFDDEFYGWGCLPKGFTNTTFFFNCSIRCTDTSQLYMKDSEVVVMNNNNYILSDGSACSMLSGENPAGFETYNGATFIMKMYYGKYFSQAGGFPGGNNELYGHSVLVKPQKVKGVADPPTSAFKDWGNVRGKVYNGYFEAYRSLSFVDDAQVLNTRVINGGSDNIEYPRKYIYSADASYTQGTGCVRMTSGVARIFGIRAWDCDCPINPYALTSHAEAVDWDMDYTVSDLMVQADGGGDCYSASGNTGSVAISFTRLFRFADAATNNPIQNADITITDSNGYAREFTTQEDGFIGAIYGNVSTSSSDSIVDTAKTWTKDISNDMLYITSGAGAGQKRIIVSNTINNLSVFPPFSNVPDTTSKYIILPRFNYQNYTTSDDINSIIQTYNPYTITINSGDYNGYTQVINISTLNEGIVDIGLTTTSEVLDKMIAIILGIAFVTGILIIIGNRFFNADLGKFGFWMAAVTWIYAGLQLPLILVLLYLDELGAAFTSLLYIDFITLFLITIGALLIFLFMVSVSMISLRKEDSNWKSKW